MSNTGQIKRYVIYGEYSKLSLVEMDESNDGNFVKYDDHLAVVSRLRQRIAGQLKLLQVAGKRIEHLESLLPDEV